MASTIYSDGSYLEKTGGMWHLEDSSSKARWVRDFLAAHPAIQPASVCEIGCGAGGILSELQRALPPHVDFIGYDISPQAHLLSQQFENERCRFVLGEAFAGSDYHDLVLVLDVIEHVEDCFEFLRRCGAKGRVKLYNVPLDTSASFTLRGFNQWDSVGHLHLFTIETALKSIEYSGQRIVDWRFAPSSFERQNKSAKTYLMNLARAVTARLNQRLAVRLFGGYSILILAE